jgi:hypothetical protein
MATPDDKKAQTKKEQDLAQEYRRVVSSAYGFVRGRETTQTFKAYTFEDALNDQIEAIEGKPANGRPNQIDRVNKVENDLVNAISKIKALPPEAFDDHDEEQDVNTAPKP